jgi:DNA-binding PucR family transcriptional regulator
MKKYQTILLALLLAACNNSNNGEAPITDKAYDSTQTVETGNNHPVLVDSILGGRNYDEYIRMGDPDTAIALWLYSNYSNFKWDDQVEEYMRWDLENEKLKNLMASLFLEDKQNDSLLPVLERNREMFVRKIRDSVEAEYKQLNGVSGMNFTFLVSRKDSIVRPLVARLLKNPNVSADEKELATNALKEMGREK